MPPNILYLHSHDTGRYIEPYGYPVSTPQLQAFANQGVLFRQAFSVSPTCSPSRAALLTGQYPKSCGMHGLASPGWGYALHQTQHHLAHVLGNAGYETVLAGVQHLAKEPVSDARGLGHQVFLNEDNLGEDVPDLEQRVAVYLERNAGSNRPWFLEVGFDETHRHGAADGLRFSKHHAYDPAALDSRHCRAPAIFPDTPETRADWASYQVGVRRLDERIGHVLAALDQSGKAANTLVIVTTDHGLAWPGMKCSLTDHGTGVMLMLRGPGGFDGGRVFDQMVTHLDVFPTVCELVGVARPSWLAGRSLLPLVRGEVAELHREIFMEQGWHEVAEPMRAVRTARYKYIRRHDPVGPKLANCDAGPTRGVLEKAGWFDRDLGPEQLFDLFLDPQERSNLAQDPTMAGRLATFRQTLDDWMHRTHDPLLRGQPVPPPAQVAIAH
jgi:N-sulfoglucosamine sulfohydrolase